MYICTMDKSQQSLYIFLCNHLFFLTIVDGFAEVNKMRYTTNHFESNVKCTLYKEKHNIM